MSELVVAALCVGLASIVGGATGFGSSLIAAPLMLLAGMGVTETVVINLIVGLATRLAAAVQLRAHMDTRRVSLLGGAAIPGAWLGVMTVSLLPETVLKPAVGVIIMVCGAAMFVPTHRPATEPSTSTNLAVGAVGGYLSTTTSLNGPPPVLMLTRAQIPPLAFIADLAGYFVITNVASLALLWLYADPSVDPATLLACLGVAMVGNQGGMAIARRLPAATFRSAVIALVIAAGAITVATG